MPMFEDDWLLSQIRLLAAAIAKIVFRKETVLYEIEDEEDLSETDELYLYLRTLLDSGEINEAEDALFDALARAIKACCSSPSIFTSVSTS